MREEAGRFAPPAQGSDGGEGGIRTHGEISPTHAFQACSFSHSDTSPREARAGCSETGAMIIRAAKPRQREAATPGAPGRLHHDEVLVEGVPPAVAHVVPLAAAVVVRVALHGLEDDASACRPAPEDDAGVVPAVAGAAVEEETAGGDAPRVETGRAGEEQAAFPGAGGQGIAGHRRSQRQVDPQGLAGLAKQEADEAGAPGPLRTLLAVH